MKIRSADLVRYNANTRGSSVGDCTARAISLAFNIDYRAARKALNDSAKEHWNWDYNSQSNCIKVIRELGGGELIKPQSKIKVNDFVDLHSSGTYIIWCSKDGTVRHTNHLACIIDGKVYDSWDSRVYYVLGYWIIESGIKGSDITDIRDYLKNVWFNEKFKPAEKAMAYVQGIFDNITDKNRKLKKLSADNDIDISLTLNLYNMTLKNNYTFQIDYSIKVYIAKYLFNKTYPHKFSITFKPTLKQEEIDSFFDDAFYSKFYSFINGTIIYYINDLCEGYKFLSDSGMDLSEPGETVSFYDKAEKRIFNNLPYWARRLATSFYINRGVYYFGEHSQEITLNIKMPTFDTEYGKTSKSSRHFDAENVEILKEMLEYYKKTGDYESACDIAYQY